MTAVEWMIKQLNINGTVIPMEIESKAKEMDMEQKKLLISFIEDIAENWDCDDDSHRYNTICRKCEAEKLLSNL